jgi:uncharacterized BrkB/YihY/UPF0761 family membrane protein
VSYYGFFSVFPLLLAFVSIVGFVLQGNPGLREDIVGSAIPEVPVIGPFVAGDVQVITGSVVALAVGVAVALWAGLGVTIALGQAFDDVWSVPRVQRFGFVGRRLRGLAVIVVAALAIVAGSLLSGTAISGQLGAGGEERAAIALSLVVDAVALIAAFRLLTPSSPALRDLLPGVGVAVAGLLVLQILGGWYVDATIARATDTYGLFATVIGLLSWLALAAHLVLVSAEVNAVRTLRLWPRSLRGAMTEADARALERYAARARHRAGERIVVQWTPDVAPGAAPGAAGGAEGKASRTAPDRRE